MNTDENLKSILLSIFLRKGALGANTRPWDDCDKKNCDALMEKLILMSGELPIIISETNTHEIILLTTRRLIQGATQILIERITDVKPVDFTKCPKSQLSRLLVTDSEGNSVLVEADVGKPYFGLWNVLLHIATKNARNK
jgi:hypothetical protein